MADLLYYATFAVTIMIVVASFALARWASINGASARSSSRRFILAAIAAGLASGVLYFHGVLWACAAAGFHVNVGHGEVLVAAPLFNAVLGLVLAAVARVILLWEQVA